MITMTHAALMLLRCMKTSLNASFLPVTKSTASVTLILFNKKQY